MDIFEDLESTIYYADVILPLPLQGSFTYRLGIEHKDTAKVGARVLVPFGKGKMYTGIICNLHQKNPGNFHVHFVQVVLDPEEPLISLEQLAFWEWMASYYMSPIGEVMHASLPAGLQFNSLTFFELNPEIYWPDENLNPLQKQIMSIIETQKKINIKDIEKLVKSKNSLIENIRELYLKDLIWITDDVQQKFKPKTETYILLDKRFFDEDFAKKQLDYLFLKAKKQYEAILTLAGMPKRESLKNSLEKEKNIQPATILSLKNKGLVHIEKRTISRLHKPDTAATILPTLSAIQSKALTDINNAWLSHNVTLLKAPTNAGKTMLYIHLIAACLKQNKQALLLVPEIALTKQLLDRILEYFPKETMVTHARFGTNNKTEVWFKVNSGEPCLIIGPRSAALLPFKKLGVVIVDEEHESTFKQFDKLPLYNGKDSAIKLAVTQKAKVLLGSATPAVESMYACQINKFKLVTFNQKYGNVNPTKIHLVKLSSSNKEQGKKTFLTKALDNAIRETIQQKKQVLLFQNKKGYVPMLECGMCQWTPKCISCDISLTYYKYSNDLRCHYCGFKQQIASTCNACKSNDMRMWGYGTERIVEELRAKYPDLAIKRFDQDSTKGKDAHSKILTDFENGNTHILVGTQMIVKGIDFANVGLCAVISADQLLNFPDFRANERTYQLITQLAGRAGRRDGQGNLIIQTGRPETPIFNTIISQEFDAFVKAELTAREDLKYPPFAKLIKITVMHRNQSIAAKSALYLSLLLKKTLHERVLGPEKPHVGKVKNQFIYHTLIKCEPSEPISKIKAWINKQSLILHTLNEYKGCRIIFDVDPF